MALCQKCGKLLRITDIMVGRCDRCTAIVEDVLDKENRVTGEGIINSNNSASIYSTKSLLDMGLIAIVIGAILVMTIFIIVIDWVEIDDILLVKDSVSDIITTTGRTG